MKPEQIALILIGLAVGPGAAGAQLAQWRTQPDLSIGSLHDEVYALTDVSALEVAPDGRVYVAQPTEQLIRVFGPDGRFLKTIGRSGGGPGEFTRIDTLSIMGGTLLAFDYQLGRATLFDLDGAYVRQWRLPQHSWPVGLIPTPPRSILSDGSMLVVPGRSSGSGITRLPLTVFDTAGDGTNGRVIGTLRVDGYVTRTEVVGQAGRVLVAQMRHPVSSHTLWSVSRADPAVLLVQRSLGTREEPGTVRLVKVSSRGDTLLSRSYRVPSVAIPAAAVERERARRIDREVARGLPRADVEAVFDASWRVPQVQAPVDRIIVADDGSIWLRRGAYLLDEATWWILNAAGDPIARLNMSTDIDVLRVSATHLWGTQRGEFDEVYVRRFRVVR